MSAFDDDAVVSPDGGRVRLLRHRRGWSRRELVEAIARASERATGLRDTITLSVLAGIEEMDEPVRYATLRLVATGLDCEPVELVQPPELPG